MGYKPAFINQKTSLKKTCLENNCLSNEFDNIWFDSYKFIITSPDAILFYQDFEDFAKAKEVSDHIPLAVELVIKQSIAYEKSAPLSIAVFYINPSC